MIPSGMTQPTAHQKGTSFLTGETGRMGVVWIEAEHELVALA